MSRSQSLRLREVQASYRLIGECREIGLDWSAWSRHMVQSLCRFVDAQVGLALESQPVDASGAVREFGCVDQGWSSQRDRGVWLAYLKAKAHREDPVLREMVLRGKGRGTWSRPQLVGDGEWYRCRTFTELHQPTGLDEALSSCATVPANNLVNWIALFRPLHHRPFGERERTLVHFFHREMVRLIGRGLVSAQELPPAGLSPRLQQTLACLLEGDSEKQIAARLNLSRATVHEYVCIVYRHFQVNTRAELLAAFLRRTGCRFVPKKAEGGRDGGRDSAADGTYASNVPE